MKSRGKLVVLAPVIAVFYMGVPSDAFAQADECHNENLRLRIDKYQIRMRPKDKPRCVILRNDGTVNMDVKMKVNIGNDLLVDLGDITVKEKPGGTLTISGTNNTLVDEVMINVSGPGELEQIFGFDIEVENLGKLDPRVRIVDDGDSLMIHGPEIRGLIDSIKLLSDLDATDEEIARQLEDALESRFNLTPTQALELLQRYDATLTE